MTGRLLITGGAGFIGINAAAYFSERGWTVSVLDNFSRRGSRANYEWLNSRSPVRTFELDIRDRGAVEQAIKESKPDAVLHLAAQVAVTTSVVDPQTDFEVNAIGTFNVLESVRRHCPGATVLYASTNKVYGGMSDVRVVEDNSSYRYADEPEGISEEKQLDFHSPYGCSKGTGDQYVLDYARTYGLRATSFRQSCIYGQRQFGIEDQGWLAWFTIAAHLGRPITIFGDGKQVRDALYVEDLLKVYELALQRPEAAAGAAFNIGGGPANVVSLLQLLEYLEEDLRRKIPVSFSGWRTGDQKVFVCDIRKAREQLGWAPTIDVRNGVQRLAKWVRENSAEIARHLDS